MLIYLIDILYIAGNSNIDQENLKEKALNLAFNLYFNQLRKALTERLFTS